MRNFITITILLFASLGFSQVKTIKAKFIETDLTIDGNLDESQWNLAEESGDFYQFFPTDSLPANQPTTFKILYSEDYIYFGVTAYARDNDFVVSSLKRDFGGTSNDNISIILDTFNDESNGYFFGITPYGVKRDGLISEGGGTRTGFNINWDGKWDADAKIFDNYYTVEARIPFNTLKFIEGQTKWRFRPYRWNIQDNEQSTWVRVPQNLLLATLAFMGEIEFEKPLGKSKKKTSFIPYINTSADKDYITDNANQFFKSGFDSKISIGNSLNLDLTFNPDFSNVEVDDIITNITRFELRLPEKRQFFLDNSDLFENFGNTFNEAKPFFSRRIGLATDKLGNLIQNDINYGLRLSGKLDENWRIGLMNIQTAEDKDNEIASNNNSMIAFQRKVGERSNIGAFLVNRETINNPSYLGEEDKYNRVLGFDYNHISSDDVTRGRFYMHKSYQPFDTKGNLSMQGTVTYQPKGWFIIQDFVYVDKDFKADLGFVPRKDFFKWGTGIGKFIYPKTGSFNSHEFRLLTINYWKAQGGKLRTDYMNSLRWEGIFKNESRLEASTLKNYIYLQYPFDPTRTSGSTPLPSKIGYTFNQFSARFTSGNTNLFTYSLGTTFGEFFNGKITSLRSQINYRFQPYTNISLLFDYNKIKLPEPYSSADIFLATARTEITFNKSLFWNTLIQFSNQGDNLGINSRLQWRFSPLSDVYLVYNDNYFTTESITPRYRSINLKVTYWLDL